MNIEKRATFGPRLKAYIIDSIFVAIIAVFVMMVFMPSTFEKYSNGEYLNILFNSDGNSISSMKQESFEALMLVYAFFPGISLLYMLIEAYYGASPGKRIQKLQIGNQDGTVSSRETYLTRCLVKNSPALLSLSAMITRWDILLSLGSYCGIIIIFGCFMVLGEKRQSIHDLMVQTAVFHKSDIRV